MHQKLHKIDQNHEVSCGLRLNANFCTMFLRRTRMCVQSINQNMRTLFGHYDCKPLGVLTLIFAGYVPLASRAPKPLFFGQL